MDLLGVYYTPLDTRRVDADGLTVTDKQLKKCGEANHIYMIGRLVEKVYSNPS